ncbi:MAG: head GIN domain-containing protein [Lacibacter sp.]
MKKIFFSAIALLLTSGSLVKAQDLTVINDKNAEVRTVGSFHAIKVSNSFDVIIKQGNEEAVVVSADDAKYRDRIKVKVEGDVLHIYYENEGKWKWGNDDHKLRAYISVKQLDFIDASGACDVKIDGVLKGTNLKVKISGATSFKGEMNFNNLLIDQSGASDSKLSGKVTNLNIQVSGASDFKGFDLMADNCIASASGASDIKITVNKDLKIDASGASDVEYKGNASLSGSKTSGASSIKKRSSK